MIIKIKIFVLIMMLFYVNGQGQNISKDSLFDVDGVILLELHSRKGQSDSIVYFNNKKETINVSSDVDYIGGWKLLNIYFDSLYFNRKDYNYIELNAFVRYCILFDSKLRIKEIRIIKRIGYDCTSYNYDELIKNILKKTEGKWRKTKKQSNKWYLFLSQIRLR